MRFNEIENGKTKGKLNTKFGFRRSKKLEWSDKEDTFYQYQRCHCCRPSDV